MKPAKDKQDSGLEALRGQIDAIDQELRRLLLERAKIVHQVGELKTKQGMNGSYINPKREAVMMRRLIESFKDTPFPPEAVESFWRTIIGASTAMESPLKLAVWCPEGDASPYFLGREYFGAFLPATLKHTPAEVLRAVTHDAHTIGVLPDLNHAHRPGWWQELAAMHEPRPLIFAALPFVQDSVTPPVRPCIAFGQVHVTETGHDTSFLVARFANGAHGEEIERWCVAAASTLGFTVLDKHAATVLLRTDGYLRPETDAYLKTRAVLAETSGERLEELCWLGAYAKPYER